jgi:vacuolar-type H+-ATPase subunit I/STV1
MTDYIKYAPQIADAFNVTKQHVFDVYAQTQITEATTWMQMSQIWGMITICGALLVGFIALYIASSSKNNDKVWDFVLGLIIGAIIFGVIAFIICTSWGSYTIQIAQPEYMTWVNYATEMKFIRVG